jgi:tetratricopeptide (TPR) repeat protein
VTRAVVSFIKERNMSETLESIAQEDNPQNASAALVGKLAALTQIGSKQRREGRLAAAAQTFAQIADHVPNDWLAQYNSGAVSLEAGQLAESSERLKRATMLHPNVAAFRLHGHVLALLGQMQASRSAYEDAVRLEPRDFAAHWGLFEVTQLLNDNAAALHHQRIALQERSLVTIPARVQPPQTTILELCIAGTFQANIPLDFILDGDRTTVHKLYLGEHPIPQLPPYDIVFNTIADAPNATPALEAAQAFIAGQQRPALNAPQLVARTSRTAIAERFAESSCVAVAPTTQTTRGTVHGSRPPYPFLIRPLDSHAGNDLAKIDDSDGLQAYFDSVAQIEDFYLSAFIDYRNADGYYRKYRIVFVDGVPYPVHLAISSNWMIHYYNAQMADNQWMRDEEHAFMRDMRSVFDGVRAAGLLEIAQTLPLDYFGIDCSIAPDGRVLLFEASTAMIVHMRDPVDLYPYKAEYVPRVIHALERLFDKRLGRDALR